MIRAAVVVLSLVASTAALGCSTTAGSAWLREPESGPFANEDLAFPPSESGDRPLAAPSVSHLVADPAVDPTPDSPTRLDHTVTLGEVVTSVPERGDAPLVGSAAPVSVTVNNYVTAPQPSYYDGYVSPYVVGGFRPGNGTPSRPGRPASPPPAMRPGQDWPAIPNHGTAFPFKTAPASPWQPAR